MEEVAISRQLKIAGYTYAKIGDALGISGATVAKYLSARKNTERHPKNALGRCEECKHIWPSLHYHHTNHKTNAFKRLCSRCHGRAHSGKPLDGKPIPKTKLRKLLTMAAKIKADRRGQFIATDLLGPTLMEEAERKVLTEEYHKAKGNISLTARRAGWSRSKTLSALRKWDLYKLYKHEPGPFKKEED